MCTNYINIFSISFIQYNVYNLHIPILSTSIIQYNVYKFNMYLTLALYTTMCTTYTYVNIIIVQYNVYNLT